jgi:glycosyltransferase involved in cell wall biosynthesis
VRLSIIVPAFNEAKCIGGSVAAIQSACRQIASPNFSCEIVVVDNNSTDGTGEIARSAGVTVVFEPKNQIARARNRGAEAATGDWLLFIDADSTLSRDLLRETVDTMNAGRVVGGGSLMRFPDGARRGLRLGMWIWNRISLTFHWAAGSYLFCRAEDFRGLGGFNEELYVSEEIDLSRRLKRLGMRKRLPLTILRRFPLLTSDRKSALYGPLTLLRFLFWATVAPRRTFRDHERCHIWYDGKR